MPNIAFDLAEILLALLSVYALGKSILPYLGMTKKAFFFTVAYASLSVAAIALLATTPIGQYALAPFVEKGLVPGGMWFLIAYALILVLSEELFFRIYLSKKILPLLAALLFSAAHWRPDHFPVLMFPILFLFAVMQGWLLQKTSSLWSVTITHLAALTTLVVIYG